MAALQNSYFEFVGLSHLMVMLKSVNFGHYTSPYIL